MKLMTKLLNYNGIKQQQKKKKLSNDATFRRGVLHIKPQDGKGPESHISPDHVEIEFEKPQYQNCESNSLYPELMIDFALSLTFCSLFPIILLWNLFTVYLKTHQFLTRKF